MSREGSLPRRARAGRNRLTTEPRPGGGASRRYRVIVTEDRRRSSTMIRTSSARTHPPLLGWLELLPFTSGLALALHGTDALALMPELGKSPPAFVLALVLAGRRDQNRLG